MKKVFLGIIVGLLAGGTGTWLFLSHHHENGEPEPKKDEHKEESHVVHGTNGETLLKLDKEAQEHAGLKTAAAEASELKPEVKAFGRVLDPAPLATALTDLMAARAQLEASSKEMERLRILFGQNQNISARSLETAEATRTRDQIALQAAHLRLLTSWGKEIAERPDMDGFVRSLVTQENALVRVDVPASEAMSAALPVARVASLTAPDSVKDAQVLGPALTADPQTLSRGFILLLKASGLAANAPVAAWLSSPGEAEKGVVIPREAIVRHEGEAFIYVQTGDETFARKEIELQHPTDKGFFSGAVTAGTKLVIVGAQQLLSEELKGEGGGE